MANQQRQYRSSSFLDDINVTDLLQTTAQTQGILSQNLSNFVVEMKRFSDKAKMFGEAKDEVEANMLSKGFQLAELGDEQSLRSVGEINKFLELRGFKGRVPLPEFDNMLGGNKAYSEYPESTIDVPGMPKLDTIFGRE